MKYLFFILLPLYVKANDQNIQKLISERAQLESLNAELQSEIRTRTSETDRINEKILALEDEIIETKRKLTEAKTKRTHFLADAGSKKTSTTTNLNREELISGINHYEEFIKNGLPWDIDQRLDKLKIIRAALHGPKESLTELTLQWSQFLEAERKLAAETQRKFRRLPIEATDQDAAVFRLGLTALYYKTATGQVGIYYRKNQRLFHQQISDEGIKAKIANLVETKDTKNADRLLSELVLTPGMVNSESL